MTCIASGDEHSRMMCLLGKPTMHDREELARTHGFETFAELLDASDALPTVEGDAAKSYIARHPRGHWFVWEIGTEPDQIARN